MFLQPNNEEQNQNHVFPQYNYPQQGSAVAPQPGSQQQYVAYTNQPDPKSGVSVVPPGAAAYMPQTPSMFYNNYSQGQPDLQPAQGGDYFQHNMPGGMRYSHQQASLPQQQQHHQGGRGMRGNRNMRGGRFYSNNNGYNGYVNMVGGHNSFNAVPEKTPTVRLFNTATQRVNHVKLNRITPTVANISTDFFVSDASPVRTPTNKMCPTFLSTQSCTLGAECPFVHIMDISKTWEPVDAKTTEVDGKAQYLPGFVFHCYDPSQTHYLSVPSETIQVTKGSSEYILSYNQHGENFKSKYVLCQQFMESNGMCEYADQCPHLHCTEKDVNRLCANNAANITHLNNALAMQNVPRLPKDMVVRAFDQNSLNTYNDYPGSDVLITVGARTYVKNVEGEHLNPSTRRRMQHCAHFRLKEMCRLGENCRFLHVLTSQEGMDNRTGVPPPQQALGGKNDMRSIDDRRATTHNPYA